MKIPNRRILIAVLILVTACICYLLTPILLPPGTVTFSPSADHLESYEFVEIATKDSSPKLRNPFTDARLTGTFQSQTSKQSWTINGFSDSSDGRLYRLRFMPSQPGDYSYKLKFVKGLYSKEFSGHFHVEEGHRRGLLRVDPQNPWHFMWEGTGEHYFFNGTTAYWLANWTDESVIRASIDRLERYKINRIRVTLAGRSNTYYGEPVMDGNSWTPLTRAWETSSFCRYLHFAGRLGQRLQRKLGLSFGQELLESMAETTLADNIYRPGFDYSRFKIDYWQRFERMVDYARGKGIVISVVLDMNDSRVHPVAGSSDEKLFFNYAVARLGAYSNITWDLGDDLNEYRDDKWTRNTGEYIKAHDPYQHLATSHPTINSHQDRTAKWFDFTSFQEWSRNQHSFMLQERQKQIALGRIIPQTNEEYGYEDHYPLWAPRPPADSADALRRTAWDIAMAGAYQTTGETARRGTNVWPDSGGGWMNGRGDDTMTMLQGYAYLYDFFTSFDWWSTEPHDDLVSVGDYCLALPGKIYAIYLPHGGSAIVHLQPGIYSAQRFDPTNGKRTDLGRISNKAVWTSPATSADHDSAFLILRSQ